MTNIIFKLLLVLSTNWTEHREGLMQLGIVQTQHVAHVEYAGDTNEFILLKENSDKCVWRTNVLTLKFTNSWSTNLFTTNIQWMPYGGTINLNTEGGPR
jgi:hypothetical protein